MREEMKQWLDEAYQEMILKRAYWAKDMKT